MARKGKDVPALKERPKLPLSLNPAVDCWMDLAGVIRWPDVMQWANYYGINGGELWITLTTAKRSVEKWQTEQSALKKSTQKRSKKVK